MKCVKLKDKKAERKMNLCTALSAIHLFLSEYYQNHTFSQFVAKQ